MDERIILRAAVLEGWNVTSAYLHLCGWDAITSTGELTARFGREMLLRQLFREPPELSWEELAADCREAEAGREGRGLFPPAFRADEEHAVSLDRHITLHRLVKREPPYGDFVPWYDQYGRRCPGGRRVVFPGGDPGGSSRASQHCVLEEIPGILKDPKNRRPQRAAVSVYSSVSSTGFP